MLVEPLSLVPNLRSSLWAVKRVRSVRGPLVRLFVCVAALLVSTPLPAHLDPRDRVHLLTRQIEERSEEAGLYLERATALVDVGRCSEALADVRRARVRGADPVSAALVEATALLALGELAAAERALDEADTAAPYGDARVFRLRARAHREQGRRGAAATDMEVVVASSARRSPDLVLQLSEDLRAVGRGTEALRWIDETLELIGPSTALHREALSLELELGRVEDALVRLDHLAETDRFPERWRRERDRLLEGLGRRWEAERGSRAAPTGPNENEVSSLLVGPGLPVEAPSTPAVEGHPSGSRSSDLGFDLEPVADGSPPPVTRGPYLQLGTPSSIVVRWRTSASEVGRVRYGESHGALTSIVDEATATTEHEVVLSGLTAATTYFYSIGVAGQIHAGGDAEYRFVTPPVAGTRMPTRIWVLGDSGTADVNAAAVRDAFEALAAGEEPDLWLMLGDNAYNSGTDGQYQAAVFDMYPRQLRRQVLWPTLGNHDGISADSTTQTGPYYDIFTLPTLAEAGGIPSGTEAYYSFDWANIHFVVLDSHGSDRSPEGAMLSWLEDDLMAAVSAATADWIIGFWHHPPYTKGSHDSDSLSDSGGRMSEMREAVLPILEDWGVDLVLTGHSHSYERSVLLDGHYGTSSTFGQGFVLDPGDGRPDGDGPYVKPTRGPAAHEGAIYVVAGSSGKVSSGTLDHPAMLVGLGVHGSLVLDVEGLVLAGTFVAKDGTIGDRFTVVKGSNPFLFVDGFELGDPSRWSSSVL